MYWIPLTGVLGDDYGACTKASSSRDGIVQFEHDGCEAFAAVAEGEWGRALADNGSSILGLDAWTLHRCGGLLEVPVSAWQAQSGETPEGAIERACREALDALPFATSEGIHVSIAW